MRDGDVEEGRADNGPIVSIGGKACFGILPLSFFLFSFVFMLLHIWLIPSVGRHAYDTIFSGCHIHFALDIPFCYKSWDMVQKT